MGFVIKPGESVVVEAEGYERSPEFEVERIEANGMFTNFIDGYQTVTWIVHGKRAIPKEN